MSPVCNLCSSKFINYKRSLIKFGAINDSKVRANFVPLGTFQTAVLAHILKPNWRQKSYSNRKTRSENCEKALSSPFEPLVARSIATMRGALIVFEGADRTGKTTQTRNLANALQKAGIAIAPASPWRFPDRTTAIGKMINAYLTNTVDVDKHAAHLLFSANRWEKVSLIRNALQSGQTVILDRYAYSGVAYSRANGLCSHWCKSPDQGLPAPDVVLFLQLSPQAAAKRAHYGDERYENEQMQQRVAQAFEELRTEQWLVIDADGDEQTVLQTILDKAMPLIVKARNRDCISTLWGSN